MEGHQTQAPPGPRLGPAFSAASPQPHPPPPPISMIWTAICSPCSARWRQLQCRQERLGWAGRGPGGSPARPLHPGRPSKHGRAKELGRNSSQMRKSCFRVGPEGSEVTCKRGCPLGHPESGRGFRGSWGEQGQMAASIGRRQPGILKNPCPQI